MSGKDRTRGVTFPGIQARPEDEFTKKVTLRIITPVLGGGSRSHEQYTHQKPADECTVVRSASVRGQLRFWWRQVCGTDRNGTPLKPKELQAREAILWGAARKGDDGGQGWISLFVDSSRLSPPQFLSWDQLDADLKYGAFSLQKAQGVPPEAPHGHLRKYTGEFIVTLRRRAWQEDGGLEEAAGKAWTGETDLPSRLWQEAIDALTVWSWFGGVGGRTRRGFGAIESIAAGDVPSDLQQRAGHLAVSAGNTMSEERAHREAVGRLRHFRQGEGLGRDPRQPGSLTPGQSRWPEPDQIRILANSNGHPVRIRVPAFPRASFGLPIIFKFKAVDVANGDPGGSFTLLPQNAGDVLGRMASPILVRPLRSSRGGYVSACLMLHRHEVDAIAANLVLQQGNASELVSGTISAPQARDVFPLNQYGDRDQPGSVLHSFLRYFQS